MIMNIRIFAQVLHPTPLKLLVSTSEGHDQTQCQKPLKHEYKQENWKGFQR